MARTREPFDGTPPDVRDGDRIEVRNAYDDWLPAVAKSAPRYDHANAHGSCWLSVSVQLSNGRVLNWPAEHVRPDPTGGA